MFDFLCEEIRSVNPSVTSCKYSNGGGEKREKKNPIQGKTKCICAAVPRIQFIIHLVVREVEMKHNTITSIRTYFARHSQMVDRNSKNKHKRDPIRTGAQH